MSNSDGEQFSEPSGFEFKRRRLENFRSRFPEDESQIPIISRSDSIASEVSAVLQRLGSSHRVDALKSVGSSRESSAAESSSLDRSLRRKRLADDSETSREPSRSSSTAVLNSLYKDKRSARKRRIPSPLLRDAKFPAADLVRVNGSHLLPRGLAVEVSVPAPLYPASLFDGRRKSDKRVSSESLAVQEILQALSQFLSDDLFIGDKPEKDQDEQYQFAELCDFEIYRAAGKMHNGSLAALNELLTRRGDGEFFFDGFLCVDKIRHYVEKVPFTILAIDGYDTDAPSITDTICIQSPIARSNALWYRLSKPAIRYRHVHEPFLWVANFAKHFVTYLLRHNDVSLSHFENRFYQWLHQYSHFKPFKLWTNAFGGRDFRSHVAMHCDFLWKEATSINDGLRKYPIWKEVDPENLSSIKRVKQLVYGTQVTPYVYDCMKHMYFGSHLISQDPLGQAATIRSRLAAELGLSVDFPVNYSLEQDSSTHTYLRPLNINNGDCVGIDRDQNSAWPDHTTMWLAYVQAIEKDKAGRRFLQLIWLYRPHETVCSTSHYPFANELFFSDHCNCEEERIYVDEVKTKISINFSPYYEGSLEREDHFVRQTYITPDEGSDKDVQFVTFDVTYRQCHHRRTNRPSEFYPYGTTALINDDRASFLEPVVILAPVSKTRVAVKEFCRRGRDLEESAAKVNELVYTDIVKIVDVRDIVRICHVRIFTPLHLKENKVPAPYCRGGVGDCWIVTGTLANGHHSYISAENPCNNEFIEGFDPNDASMGVLRGLSLFSGGGSYDRGLEDGGAVEIQHAIDWDREALHTYRANLKDTKTAQLSLGSVDDYLRLALLDTSNVTAKIGSVDLISGGSPCQGYSSMQPDHMSERSLLNASKIASIAAYVNLYCPKYAIFENVLNMARNFGKDKEENVFSQLVSVFVGMGYQVAVFNIDAWSYGSAQSRGRLFLSLTAPGLRPIQAPRQTHSHPEKRSRCMGTCPSQIRYGFRRFEATPFKFTTFHEATKDLPNIGQGNVTTCVQFPDHRLTAPQNTVSRATEASIPRFPYGQGYAEALKAGLISKAVLDWHGATRKSNIWNGPLNKAFKRIRPDYVSSTILTTTCVADAKSGQYMHPDQHRSISLQESRRCQGIPDHEVLIGQPSKKLFIVGNSVDRNVATAFGLSLREARLSRVDEIPAEQGIVVPITTPTRTDTDMQIAPEEEEDEMNQDEPDIPTSFDASFPATVNDHTRSLAMAREQVTVTAKAPTAHECKDENTEEYVQDDYAQEDHAQEDYAQRYYAQGYIQQDDDCIMIPRAAIVEEGDEADDEGEDDDIQNDSNHSIKEVVPRATPEVENEDEGHLSESDCIVVALPENVKLPTRYMTSQGSPI